jgi:hypothetical protein
VIYPMALLSRLAGVDSIAATLEAQDAATAEHRIWEGERLRSIEALAVKTNGRVTKTELDLAVVKDREEQAAKLEAAKVKGEEEARSRRLSWRQLAFSVLGGSVATGAITAALYLTHVIPH